MIGLLWLTIAYKRLFGRCISWFLLMSGWDAHFWYQKEKQKTAMALGGLSTCQLWFEGISDIHIGAGMSTMKLNGIELKQISKGNKIYTSINFNHTSYSCLMCFCIVFLSRSKRKDGSFPPKRTAPACQKAGPALKRMSFFNPRFFWWKLLVSGSVHIFSREQEDLNVQMYIPST